LRVPELCRGPAVLFLVLSGVLLALCFVLFESQPGRFAWESLGRSAAFICWNLLASAGVLCLLRERLGRGSLPLASMLAFLAILMVCLVSGLAQRWLLGTLIEGEPFVVDSQLLARDLLICALLGGAALRYFHLQGELIARERAELDARVRALQARIRPHFLFNSMNIIASLIPVAPEQAERAVEDLSVLFRASLREGERTVPLAEELELCDRYMRLEGWRLGDRLHFESRITPLEPGLRVPPLSVQPLLENAVYHGIQPRPEGGTVLLELRREQDALLIEVRNPLAESDMPGSGIALGNIRARLAAIYGESARLETAREGDAFRATLRIPAVSVL
jgi:two-component system sensor histidine kinase AlgZ